MKAELFRLFPTPVIKVNIGRLLTEEELNVMNELGVYVPNKENLMSDNKRILSDPRLKSIAEFCYNGLSFYKDQIFKPENEVHIYITQSWLNKTVKGAAHHVHYHRNSLLSGVFYVNAEWGKDRIFFESRSPEPILHMPAKEWTVDNSTIWHVPVRTGDLVLFPSYIRHYVDNNEHDHERISLAFDTFAYGSFGIVDRATELILDPPVGLRNA